MKIFIDSDFKCHAEDDGSMREVETNFFDGKCRAFIEGYRFVPVGEEWEYGGETFIGEMVAPWRDYNTLMELQAQYDEMLAAQEDMQAALALLGVTDEEGEA